MRLSVPSIPLRTSTGAYILHAGLEKWRGEPATAEAVHGMAAGAYPFLKTVPPPVFLKALAAAEIALGTALLAPTVRNRTAGAGLTAFAGGLLGMYLRTPALHRPGSVWPTQAGVGVSKDVWMLGIGIGLVADGVRP